MKIEGSHRFEAPRQAVWDALMDPEVLASTLPGFDALERVGEHEFAGALRLGVGPVQGRFEGRVTLSDLQPPSAYRLELSGRGAPGFVEGDGQIRLQEDGEATLLLYEVDAKVGGRVAAVGQRLLDMTARMISKQALGSLERAIEARTG